jgi:hypothetical protein
MNVRKVPQEKQTFLVLTPLILSKSSNELYDQVEPIGIEPFDWGFFGRFKGSFLKGSSLVHGHTLLVYDTAVSKGKAASRHGCSVCVQVTAVNEKVKIIKNFSLF